MRNPLTALVLIVGATVSTSALAATVIPVKGQSSLSTGGGFHALKRQTDAKAGDQVMANAGGSAVIVYSATCRITVEPGAVVTVLDAAPCVAGGTTTADGFAVAVMAGGLTFGLIGALADEAKGASP